MQRLAIGILSLALIAVSSAAAVETKYPHGGFDPRLDKLQGLLDYTHTVEKIEVKAGPKLGQAIEAIPIATGVPITPAQEADLRDWLYDFLVAFSASGNDSLAAEFYLRGGVNAEGIAELKRQLAAIKLGGPLTAQQLQTMGYRQMPELPVDATPFDLFKAMHRFSLNVKRDEFHMNRRDYCFDKVSFFDSAYRVF